jgi:hypothetical protein
LDTRAQAEGLQDVALASAGLAGDDEIVAAPYPSGERRA